MTPLLSGDCEGRERVSRNNRGMEAYAELQEAEFAAEKHRYSPTKHQHEVGTGYFDDLAQVIAVGLSSTPALRGSTEHEQFH